ncbi:MAG: C-GCAxxG-C-C family protein [Bacteroidota bacterium]
MKKLASSDSIVDKAVHSFKTGLNCSQSILDAYSDLLDIDKKFAQSISSGFGAGMGRLQETCGAVTGSYMVLSIFSSKKFEDNNDIKENSYIMIKDFNHKFIEKQKTTSCRQLLNCDLNTEAGQQHYHDNNLMDTVCKVCISESVKILNGVIEAK